MTTNVNIMNISYQCYRQMSDVPLDASSWATLVDANHTSSVFLGYDWVQCWWNDFSAEYKLLFLTAEENGQVVAFAPLMIDQQQSVRFIADLNSDYLDFVIPPSNPEIVHGFCKYLHDSSDEWGVIHLRNIPRNSPVIEALPDACRQSRLSMWKNYSIEAPYLAINGNSEYVDRLLSKYSIRRSERQLSKLGNVRFAVFKTASEVNRFWEIFVQQHIERCRLVKRKSAFEDPKYSAFLKALLDGDTRNKYTHFSAVFLDDHPVAFHFGFVSQKRLLWYKPSYDTNIRKGSPGVVLIKYLIKFAQESGLEELDFTIGREGFKKRFCERQRMVDTVRIYKSRSRLFSDHAYWYMRRALKVALTKFTTMRK